MAGWARLYGRDGSHGSDGDEQKEIVKCDPTTQIVNKDLTIAMPGFVRLPQVQGV